MKCCICGNKITDWGNNPQGAILSNGKRPEFKENSRCCDSCNWAYVIPGRLMLLKEGRGHK